MIRDFLVAIRVLGLFTLLTGVAYPALITGAANLLFPHQAQGSPVVVDGRVVGSSLVGQPFDDARYLHGRPSSTAPFANNAAASTGSNLGPGNPALVQAATERARAWRALHGEAAPVPADVISSSASGLDPHVSPAGALAQVDRVARARSMDTARVRAVVERHVEPRWLDVMGEPRVNVLLVNVALDAESRGAP